MTNSSFSRTIARARELEDEERENVRQSVGQHGGSIRTPDDFAEFSDDPEEQTAAATLARDELDYFDESPTGPSGDEESDSFRHTYTDGEEDDVFGHGDGSDEEEIIGLHRAVKTP